MNEMRKQLLALFLGIYLFLTMLPVSTLAEAKDPNAIWVLGHAFSLESVEKKDSWQDALMRESGNPHG